MESPLFDKNIINSNSSFRSKPFRKNILEHKNPDFEENRLTSKPDNITSLRANPMSEQSFSQS